MGHVETLLSATLRLLLRALTSALIRLSLSLGLSLQLRSHLLFTLLIAQELLLLETFSDVAFPLLLLLTSLLYVLSFALPQSQLPLTHLLELLLLLPLGLLRLSLR
jgi:hypothetical protein